MKRTARLAAALAVAAAVAASFTAPAPAADVVPVADPLPRIAAGPDRALVDTETGAPFEPRGFNYVRLTAMPSNAANPYHSTFEPGLYDAARADAMLADVTMRGYNTVRVFLDPGNGQDNLMGEPHGLGHGDADLSPANAAYLDNVADFVRRAAGYGVYVLPSMDVFPQNGYYRDIIVNSPQPVNIVGRNRSYMYEGYIRAKEEYLRVFTTEMTARLGDLMSTFLALQLDNEAYLNHTEAPFHQFSGQMTVAGRTYQMADRMQRQAAADAAFVAYADRGVAAVKAVDPDLMVTMGAFTNLAVKKTFDGLSGVCDGAPCGDPRYPVRVSTLTRDSDLDFLDIHLYLATGRTLAASLGSMEWSQVTGPVINGEFGTERRWFGNDIQQAWPALVDHQVGSCTYGITGWLYWTWDTNEDATQQKFFTGVEAGGVIAGALSPRQRPDPCSTTQVRVRHMTVYPLAAAERPLARPQFRGGGPDGTVTLSVNGEEAGRTTSDGRGWQLRPARDLPLGEPFDAVFRLYRDGRLADLVTIEDVVLGG
ncbi:cellulase family glycosylhydrolase [Jiangella alkaliphila]|uniref:Cellulase (Glycosyl hydrolase family 5) n=1 Tax=Jiangella alkaliphila TaxID=419479 RepID=A0A1H2M1A7_9ACTN|nr:cellulase family glycosylhydrolase [Jiangella alkaliphila]SDU87010.1 Cellulase (glycosyl hydrolase family 5) [Jiangella alkaliphila]